MQQVRSPSALVWILFGKLPQSGYFGGNAYRTFRPAALRVRRRLKGRGWYWWREGAGATLASIAGGKCRAVFRAASQDA